MRVAIELFYMPIAFILLNQFVKLIACYKLYDLGEYKLTFIHNLDAINNKAKNQFQIKKSICSYFIKY